MTGEIDVLGRISAIGGLEAKLVAAKKAGAKHALVPKENEGDLMDIVKNQPELLKDPSVFKVTFVDDIREVLKIALIDDETKA